MPSQQDTSRQAQSNSMFSDYSARLSALMARYDWSPVSELAEEFLDCWKTGRQIFVAGNGGSAGNAIHLANDFIYGISKKPGSGLRIHALPANPAVLTCLANDEGYDQIFSLQLAVQARAGDVLVVLSGSGNSPNILNSWVFGRAGLGDDGCTYSFPDRRHADIRGYAAHCRTHDYAMAL